MRVLGVWGGHRGPNLEGQYFRDLMLWTGVTDAWGGRLYLIIEVRLTFYLINDVDVWGDRPYLFSRGQ